MLGQNYILKGDIFVKTRYHKNAFSEKKIKTQIDISESFFSENGIMETQSCRKIIFRQIFFKLISFAEKKLIFVKISLKTVS